MKLLKIIFAKTYYLLGFYHLSLRKKVKENSITVLCLHLVNNDNKLSYPALKITEFENILKYLKNNYNIISFADIDNCGNLSPSGNKKPFAIITFDDGYKDYYEIALPLLNKYGFVSNLNIVYDAVEKNELIWTQKIHCIFEHLMLRENISEININNVDYRLNPENIAKISNDVIADLLQQNAECRNLFIENLLKYTKQKVDYTYLMNWDDVFDCQVKGVTIGSHTLSHAAFNDNSSEDYITKEIVNSKIEIENKLKNLVDIIALPNGLHNLSVLKKCFDAGYKYILLVAGGYNNVVTYKENCFLVNRILIHHNNFYENVLDIEHVYFYIKKILGKK